MIFVADKNIARQIVLLRLEGMAPEDRADLVVRVIEANTVSLSGAFTVVSRDKVRRRQLHP